MSALLRAQNLLKKHSVKNKDKEQGELERSKDEKSNIINVKQVVVEEKKNDDDDEEEVQMYLKSLKDKREGVKKNNNVILSNTHSSAPKEKELFITSISSVENSRLDSKSATESNDDEDLKEYLKSLKEREKPAKQDVIIPIFKTNNESNVAKIGGLPVNGTLKKDYDRVSAVKEIQSKHVFGNIRSMTDFLNSSDSESEVSENIQAIDEESFSQPKSTVKQTQATSAVIQSEPKLATSAVIQSEPKLATSSKATSTGYVPEGIGAKFVAPLTEASLINSFMERHLTLILKQIQTAKENSELANETRIKPDHY